MKIFLMSFFRTLKNQILIFQFLIKKISKIYSQIFYLYKAVVERKGMSDGILPSLLVLAVVGKKIHDKLVNLIESAHFSR